MRGALYALLLSDAIDYTAGILAPSLRLHCRVTIAVHTMPYKDVRMLIHQLAMPTYTNMHTYTQDTHTHTHALAHAYAHAHARARML